MLPECPLLPATCNLQHEVQSLQHEAQSLQDAGPHPKSSSCSRDIWGLSHSLAKGLFRGPRSSPEADTPRIDLPVGLGWSEAFRVVYTEPLQAKGSQGFQGGVLPGAS